MAGGGTGGVLQALGAVCTHGTSKALVPWEAGLGGGRYSDKFDFFFFF